MNNSNSNSDSTDNNIVVIPIDPEVIMRGYPNMEMNVSSTPELKSSSIHATISNDLSVPTGTLYARLPSNKTEIETPPPPGLAGNNNKQSKHGDNNSNGNGHVNKEDSNSHPSFINDNNNNTTNDYSQSPFNPLAMTFIDSDTQNYKNETNTKSNNNYNNEANTNKEALSLASNQFKLFINETLKKVSEPSGSSSLKARLIVPQNVDEDGRWGLKIFGPRADLVQAAKKEIMRSSTLSTLEDDKVDFETSLRTSKTIESLLLEEDDDNNACVSTSQETLAESSEISSIQFPVLASLSGLLLGPKYHMVKQSLSEFDCTISCETSLAFIQTNSSLNFDVSGRNAKAVSSVIQILKGRSDRLDEIQLAITTLVIDSGKLDWIYSSGAIKHVEEALWSTGGTITQLSDSLYQVTCLSGALLSSCLKRIHSILSRHQSIHFTFRFRNDYRDFSTKCTGIFESIAQVTNCSVSQRSLNGSVEVEIGGSSDDIARALIRLDTFRFQIFESGSCDLKLIERRLRLHAPAEIREFICGKKDGKLNRIIKETGVNISLNVLGGDSMYIDLIVEDRQGFSFGSGALLHALRLIEGELPSELTFHVPEVHHKRMIGHGGKVIQRIMKKWGVYVKFMNCNETIQCNLQSDPLEVVNPNNSEGQPPLDNVVVRTPSKNGSALLAIKDEIFEECSVSEITGQYDPESFKSLQRIQSSSKSRVSVCLPLKHRQSLKSLLKMLECTCNLVNFHLFQRPEADLIILEGCRREIGEIISEMAEELKNEIEFESETGEIVIKSPAPMTADTYSTHSTFGTHSTTSTNNTLSSTSSILSDESFKFFPSALFVIQSHQSISASGSPILSLNDLNSAEDNSLQFLPSPSSSIAMNSLNSSISSPQLPVGHQKNNFLLNSKNNSNSCEINFALAETRRRSADIFLTQ